MSVTTPNQRGNFKFPSVFSRSWSNSEDVEKVKDFFIKEGGSIVITEATCLTHKVDISISSRKSFVQPFIDVVHNLANTKEDDREEAFRRFVSEFGTHYSRTSEMGTKLTIERRYSAYERSTADDNELKDCTTMAGVKIFGLQTGDDSVNCDQEELMNKYLNSSTVERSVITTYGSFIAETLGDWSKQVVSLVQAGSFNPRVIRRDLRSILHLFNNKNFKDVNVSHLFDWMSEMMEKYCQVFNISCNDSGCGIDDTCTPDQWCIPKDGNNDGDYQCVHRSKSG